MKTSSAITRIWVSAAALTLNAALPLFAEGDTNAVTAPAATVTTTAASVKLPYGAEDVLKLSQAGISEDVVLNYVQSSGTIYNLTPVDIVYLKKGGVTDRVVNAMLDQRKKVTESSTPAVSQPVPTAPAIETEGVAPAEAPVYTEPAVTEAAAPASTLFVIPYPAARAAYFGAYSYYRPYGYIGGPYYGGPYYGGGSYCAPYYRGYCGPYRHAGYYGGARVHGYAYRH